MSSPETQGGMQAQHEEGQTRSDEESREEFLPQMKQNGREWGRERGPEMETNAIAQWRGSFFPKKKCGWKFPNFHPRFNPPLVEWRRTNIQPCEQAKRLMKRFRHEMRRAENCKRSPEVGNL